MNKDLLIILVISMVLGSCKTIKAPDKGNLQEFTFPVDWIGNYEGRLTISPFKGDTTEINMQLHIGSLDNQGFYPWTIIYNNEDIRSYGLEAINAESGHYRIDEFNSIKLDAYYVSGHLMSRFEVMGSDLLVDYERTDKGMEINFFISASQAISETGNEIIASDTIPPVKSYAFRVFQKALLTKVNTSLKN